MKKREEMDKTNYYSDIDAIYKKWSISIKLYNITLSNKLSSTSKLKNKNFLGKWNTK